MALQLDPKTTPLETKETGYESHAQPLTGQLLRALEMSVVYEQGQGQWLSALIQGERRSILDMTGGYGANLLGHKNPLVIEKAAHYLKYGEPSLVQGSNRASTGELAQRLSDLLKAETGEGPWITTLSNSGTEAVEAALKHCLIAYAKKQQERMQELQKGLNEVRLFIQELDDSEVQALLRDWRYRLTMFCSDLRASDSRKDWLLHMAMQTHSIDGLLELVESYNQSQLAEKPILFALERAYHGKTLGSLTLTYNSKYREPFYVDEKTVQFLPTYATDEELQKNFSDHSLDLIELGIHQIGIFFGKTNISRVAGLFVEPIQGEAGIYPLDGNYLALLKKYSLKESVPLVFDEIQAGMYRTGLLASGHHSHVTADIYCFSKALGGGVAKIGATCIHSRRYQEDFGYLHASTFAEDGYSAAVGCEVLNLLTQKQTLQQGMQQGEYLKSCLDLLHDEFPQIISEVRGKGLMLAIEFSQELKNICFEFRVFAEAQMIGYIISSALLHHENVRMAPSLSNGSTLRVQPTIFITRDEINYFIIALRRVCLQLQSGNFTYFFQQLYPNTELESLPAKLISAEFTKSERPLAVFLCHLIDADHVKRVTPAFRNVPDAVLEKRLALMKRAMEFGVYHAQTLTVSEGKEIDIILMGIAMTSSELKKSFIGKGRSDLIAKVQRAVDYAKELGANTVGLGQFTSIVSGNGLYLDSRGMNLTTGNSYTIALAIEAATREAQKKNLNLTTATVGMVGAAGNIVSVAAMLMADVVQKLVLIHHTTLEKSPKLMSVLKTILRESLQSEADSSFNSWLKSSLPNGCLDQDAELLAWINLPHTRNHLIVTDDLSLLKECSIIITGASSGQGFLQPEHFGKDAVIVDVAVPANIKPEVLTTLRSQRKDVTYLLGGVAKLPGDQSIMTPLFPLADNESFACMAETFAMGFSDLKDIHHTGNLTKKMVMRSIDIAKLAGFSLGSNKEKNSL